MLYKLGNISNIGVYRKASVMKVMKSTDAANSFSELVDSARDEPVTIEKYGKPVAVVYSYEEAKKLEELKLQQMRDYVAIGLKAVDEGRTQLLTRDLMDEIKADGHKQYLEASQK